MDVQTLRAEAFKALHERPGAFVIPNPWDAGSAKMLASLGFEALATTSAGLAFSLGRPDAEGALSREQTLDNALSIVDATALPVAADLENGFSDEPSGCAETILQAARIGLVGGSIEDATGREDEPIYSFHRAVERVEAAVAAARSLDFPFMLCARAENLLNGRQDLDDTIARLQAFAEAGADVLYAPGLRSAEDIRRVVQAVAPKPVNLLMGLSGMTLTFDDVQALGVKRISVGSSLARAAYGAFFDAAKRIRGDGCFDYAEQALPFDQLNQMFRR
ncbi:MULTISPECIES: oxaloacetate decarboxylase [unclassified Pseudomonas]|uniref:isocitrate lyase/PEP mutase family protein n=1 Tax=unclassified Pseudomonas TaxID=196821 RepID=UPI0021C87E52|nr:MULTISPECIES: isocitrate lyase/phosphoenolpyruvate mutase family protein [unclassified Pseudomonas]MCU1733520.1 isocitrate lyase/phosphoenolpyruvate mutase family protein [Pseudomonas sp. 20P_3.2_Bac4]MCU1746487.1 isocitrate lyase/phosphoenolpyruvate mutase family protein [Pseudomonas sp. 20P_3.2_Bac5]